MNNYELRRVILQDHRGRRVPTVVVVVVVGAVRLHGDSAVHALVTMTTDTLPRIQHLLARSFTMATIEASICDDVDMH